MRFKLGILSARPACATSSAAASAAALPQIYAEVADELAAQYTLGYASRNARRDGRWRRIVVRVERPDAVARTKQGYYGPTE